ncbi:MAG: hypothetical protein IH585_05855 [Anaerolineaceae bacterium]|nr:hypothetical protein [Anaerolineaceae bacterium]
MKKLLIIALLSVVILSGCSDMPLKLKKTASHEMLIFIAQNSNITEDNLYLEPLLIDQFQVTEDKWCLTYEIGHLLCFSTMWEKQERNWVRTEIRPFVENCNWAR